MYCFPFVVLVLRLPKCKDTKIKREMQAFCRFSLFCAQLFVLFRNPNPAAPFKWYSAPLISVPLMGGTMDVRGEDHRSPTTYDF